MRSMKDVFVITCTAVVVFTIYAMLNFVLSGAFWSIIQFWDKSLAFIVFRTSFIVLLILEAIPTVFALHRAIFDDVEEEEEE